MWKPDHEEGWVPKNWGFLTVVLEKTVENPLDSRWVKPVNPKGNQPWIFTARNGYLCSSWSSYTSATWSNELTHWKGPWCWQRLGTLGEGDDRGWDGWHHQLDGHEFQQALVTVKDREAWNAAVYGAEKSQTQLSDWTKQRFVMTSCKEQASFNFMAAVTISSYYETQGNKICHYLYFFLIYLPWSDGNECHDLCFSNVEFHASFFTLLFFHPHQEAL